MKYLKLQARFAPPTAGLLETAAGGLPLVQSQGLNTAKAANLSGFLVDASGNVTVPGTLLVTGVATLTATPIFTSGQTEKTINSALVGATVVLTAAQSGTTCINVSTSGTPVWTLPAVANGLYFNFVCGNTTAGFAVNTTTAAVIHAKTTATGTAITSTATTGAITNTQATAVVGDALQLMCDGTAWWAVAQTGIFASS